MKRVKTYLKFVLLFIVFFIFSCTKYEDDETLLHLRSSEKRLTSMWHFDAAYQDETDVTDTLLAILPNYWIDYKFNKTYYAYAFNDSLISYGTWVFIDNEKTELVRYPTSGGVVSNIVKRLDKNDFWLETWIDDWNDSVEYRFSRIE